LSLTNGCAANQVLQYNGSSWVCAAVGTGTITGVTAGTDLLGGGTSGNVTLSLNTTAINGLYAQLAAANTFTGNQTVNGTLTATSSGNTIVGASTATFGTGVQGQATATTGNNYGVFGETWSSSGSGVLGSGPGLGVFGTGLSGVLGETQATSFGGTGVSGYALGETGSSYGVYGLAYSPDAYAVYAQNGASTGTTAAVYGNTASPQGYGVYGVSYSGSNEGGEITVPAGVWGDSSETVGVLGTSDDDYAGAFYNGTSALATIYAKNTTGASGGAVFVGEVPYEESDGAKVLAIIGDPGCGAGDNRMAVQLSQGGMTNCTNYTLTAGNNGETYVNANANETVHLRVNNVDSLVASGSGVNVVGTLSKGGGSFKIDHPLDPANKYLYHSFVESPDMKDIYDGVAELDGSGEAVIALPDWFQALNKDFRYQLTTIGGYAPVYIAAEVANNQFKIAGGKPGIKVSWQVTGIRQDAFANANRIPVEAEKVPADRGRYLYPEAIGAPASARIGYEAIPSESEQVAHHKRPNLHRRNASPSQPITLPVPPRPVLPRAASLPHVARQAHQPEVNQK
jgi:hypothetical protein